MWFCGCRLGERKAGLNPPWLAQARVFVCEAARREKLIRTTSKAKKRKARQNEDHCASFGQHCADRRIPTAIFKNLLMPFDRVRSYPYPLQIKRSRRTPAFVQGRSVSPHACKRRWDGRLASTGALGLVRPAGADGAGVRTNEKQCRTGERRAGAAAPARA